MGDGCGDEDRRVARDGGDQTIDWNEIDVISYGIFAPANFTVAPGPNIMSCRVKKDRSMNILLIIPLLMMIGLTTVQSGSTNHQESNNDNKRRSQLLRELVRISQEIY